MTFKNPPVGEVSFGLGFAALATFKVAHFGSFWDLIRKDYPECEDKPPVLDPTSLPVGMSGWFPLPRVWYLHRDRNFLIQLQQNRIWLNWRRLNESEQYPSFETLFPIFQATVARFVDFVHGNNLGEIMPNVAELAYVNQIPSGDSSRPYSDVGEFMEDLRSPHYKYLPSPDGIAWRSEFTVGEDKLSIDLKSGKEIAGAQRSIYMLEIRSSRNFRDQSTAIPFDWFMTANKLIVNAFCDVTTEKAQREYWQRTD